MIQKAGNSVLSNVEKAIYSYNHLVENLNLICETTVGSNNINILDVRCVGSNPLSKNSENSTLYTSEFMQNNPGNPNYSNYSKGALDKIMKSRDQNYDTDYTQMQWLGILETDNSNGSETYYWFASRETYSGDFYARYMQYIDSGNFGHTGDTLIAVSSYNVLPSDRCYGIRPVVSITPGILDNATGSGTSVDPFIIPANN